MDKKYLKRRGNIWYVQRGIPKRLQAYFDGKTQLVHSLQTSNLVEANKRKHKVLAHFQNLLDEAEGHTPDNIIDMVKQSINLNVDKDMVYEAVSNYLDHNDVSPTLARTAFTLIDGGLLLSDLIQDYLKAEEAYIIHSTLMEKTRHLKAFLKHCGGDISLQELDRAKVRDYLNNVIIPLDRSSKVKEKMLANLRVFFDWCVSRGYMEDNLTWGLKVRTRTLKGTKDVKKRDYWTDEQIQLLLKENTDDRLDALIRIAIYTGMRLNEITGLRLEDVHNNCFHVREGKTISSTRLVPIHNELLPIVKQLQESSSDGYLLSGLKEGGQDNKRGHSISKKFGRMKTSLGFDKTLVFHSFRKSFITKLDQAQARPLDVKRLVGHKVADITYGLYSENADIDQLKQTIELVKYDIN